MPRLMLGPSFQSPPALLPLLPLPFWLPWPCTFCELPLPLPWPFPLPGSANAIAELKTKASEEIVAIHVRDLIMRRAFMGGCSCVILTLHISLVYSSWPVVDYSQAHQHGLTGAISWT
ncbi:hypothetical protein EMIT0P395_10472 [Pseudomonas sp. IT-P395]